MSLSTTDHRLFVERINLLGGNRSVHFKPGLNLVTGPISTGKTTLIRLVEVALSVTPSNLPPETAAVHAIDLVAQLGPSRWGVYRPLVSTADATVSVAELDGAETVDPIGSAISLPARGFTGSYARFMLDRLGLPAIAIPESGPTGSPRLNPVSMTDFLSYCVIRGEDLDSDVFGHDHPFRDNKRKYVFRLVYGLHDPELSRIDAELKTVLRQLDALATEEVTINKFLKGTPFAGAEALEAELALREELLESVDAQERTLQEIAVNSAGEISTLRLRVLDLREAADAAIARVREMTTQIRSLDELERQLQSQSARLTRAIVADEWLVDFDFVVCPRCGTSVNPQDDTDRCYLCHQVPTTHSGRDSLIAEQARVATQVDETRSLRELRQASREMAKSEAAIASRELDQAGRDLDRASGRFVSDRATQLQSLASRRTKLETEIEKIREYAGLFQRRLDRDEERAQLAARADDLETEALKLRSRSAGAEEKIQALEKRMLSYLERLHVPTLSDSLTVHINRTTFLPEVSGRTFDELSSQGLKTLVNVAHALAHHTVAIDLALPLPGLLILDGISANSGHEGFDQARIDDAYRLLIDEAQRYGADLQLIVVDNTLPVHLFGDPPPIALLLSHEDRLIRPAVHSSTDAAPNSEPNIGETER